MRLTNTIRDAFIHSAMNDVPRVDFKEEFRELVTKGCLEALPEKIKTMYKDPDLSHYVVSHYFNPRRGDKLHDLYCAVGSIQVPGTPPGYNESYKFNEKITKELELLLAKSKEQDKKLNTLRTKLKAVVYGCTTRKALAEALPEFVKYLPVEISTGLDRSLPTITNVVSEFTEAGWPKGKTA